MSFRPDYFANNNSFQESNVILYKDLDQYKSFPTGVSIPLNAQQQSQYKIVSHVQDTYFSNLFFSQQNVQNIQNELRYRVYTTSGNRHIIPEQNVNALGVILERIYSDYSSNPNERCQFKAEIARLNELVLRYCVPVVLSGIEMQLAYIQKITSPVVNQIGGGIFTSTKGTKMNVYINPGFD